MKFLKEIQQIVFSICFLLVSITSFGQAQNNYALVEYNDLQYVDAALVSNDSLRRLNLVVPITETEPPLMIWIGGGAWSYVDRNQERDFADKLAKEGIAVASVGHRLSSAVWKDSTLNTGVQHPKHIEDIAASVKWLHRNSEKYGYDRDQIFIGGFSSGGHLAALIGLDSTYLQQVGLSSTVLKGLIPISGTYDVVDYHQVFQNGSRPELAETHVEAVFGSTEEALMGASPTSYLGNLATPMLLMSDNKVYKYTKLFEERILETDFRDLKVVYAYELSHGELWRDLSFSEKSMYRDMIIYFIENTLK